MSPRELIEWREYARLEPFGEWRDDLRAGTIAAQIWNANPYRKKGSEPVKATDFLPTFDVPTSAKARAKEAPVLSDDMIALQASMLNAAFGGVDAREEMSSDGSVPVSYADPDYEIVAPEDEE